MSFIVAGYADAAQYESNELSWDGDEVYETKDEAEEAATAWLNDQADSACVEIIELGDDTSKGLVRRVVTKVGYEDILYPGNANPWS